MGHRILASIVCLCMCSVGWALDMESQRQFDIPAQKLSTALVEFSRQAKTPIVSSTPDVERFNSPGVSGRMSLKQALRTLLQGTGLEIRTTDNGAIAVGMFGAKPLLESESGAKTSGLSHASDSPMAAANSSDSERGALSEIVVTAERREENIKDVPLALTALSGDQLRAQHIETGADLQNYVPSLNVSASMTRNDYVYVIRGMGPTAGLPTAGGTTVGGGTGVVAYFAEVPTTGAGPGLFYDLENVQVANGPQGTLFGKNTTGGVILFVPRKPTNEFEGSVDVGYGNYNMRTSAAVINIPVVDDTLLVRFSAQVKDRDGFTVDRGPFYPGKDYDNVDYWAARASIVWRPTEGLENYTIVNALHSDENGDGYVLSAVNPAGPFAGILAPFFRQQLAAGPCSTSLSDDEFDRRYDYGFINTTKWTISGNFQFKNIFYINQRVVLERRHALVEALYTAGARDDHIDMTG
jgi:iron complex outermembrane recepter protein